MDSKAQLIQKSISNIDSKTNDASKVSELENLKSYLNMKIDESGSGSGNNINEIAGKSANVMYLKKLRDSLLDKIKETKTSIAQQSQLINRKDKEINMSEEQLARQAKEIEYKKTLLLTRDRMLELSQEQNVYKKKVIFTLLAVIFGIILLMITTMFYLRKTG
jgi:hypothetical protein